MRDSIDKLQAEIDSLQLNLVDTETNYAMECERLNEELTEKHRELDTNLAEKNLEIEQALDKLSQIERELEITQVSYENKLEDLVSHKDHEINSLQEELQTILDKNNNEISKLQKILDETSQSGELQKSERIELSLKVNKLETLIVEKTKQIDESKLTIVELTSDLENLKIEHENENKENKHQLTSLENKLQNVTESKNEIINNFKSMVAEKDTQVISLNVAVTKLNEEVSRLGDQLNETQAELEIGNNELIALKEEHESIIQRRDENLTIKNQELRDLHDQINTLKHNQIQLETEKEQVINEKAEVKQVCNQNEISFMDCDVLILRLTTFYLLGFRD